MRVYKMPLRGGNTRDGQTDGRTLLYYMWSVDPNQNVDFCTGQPVSSALTLLCLEMPVFCDLFLVAVFFAAIPPYTMFGYMSSCVYCSRNLSKVIMDVCRTLFLQRAVGHSFLQCIG